MMRLRFKVILIKGRLLSGELRLKLLVERPNEKLEEPAEKSVKEISFCFSLQKSPLQIVEMTKARIIIDFHRGRLITR